MTRIARGFLLSALALVACTDDKPAKKNAPPAAPAPAPPAPAPPPAAVSEPPADPVRDPRDEDRAEAERIARDAIEAQRRMIGEKRKARDQAIDSMGAELSYLDRRIAQSERELAAATSDADRTAAAGEIERLRAQRAELQAKRDRTAAER